MPPLSVSIVLQVILGLGLLNVWLLRASSATPYRGGEAVSLRQEFAAYGLAGWVFFLTGFLKVGSALLLIAGLWFPNLVLPASGVVVGLMVGALAMHWKVKDPAIRSFPALAMLAMSALLLVLQVA
ncbi:MAG: hypothetical protein ACI835_005328 [Planctomycetota bacterium]|jgi:hypothetical protein